MPPHCDSMDGPVVTAARRALDGDDVDLVLPYVPASAEGEVTAAFRLATRVRGAGDEAKALADQSFFETVVRLHRAGEGAPFTGLKPAGLDVGPVIPLAEQAISSGDPSALADFLAEEAREETLHRFETMRRARPDDERDIASQREYVERMLGLQVWAHHLHQNIHAAAPEHGAHTHDHGG